jgi:hypothetical protein
MEGNGQFHAMAALSLWKEPSCKNRIRSWVGLRAGVDAVTRHRTLVIQSVAWSLC